MFLLLRLQLEQFLPQQTPAEQVTHRARQGRHRGQKQSFRFSATCSTLQLSPHQAPERWRQQDLPSHSPASATPRPCSSPCYTGVASSILPPGCQRGAVLGWTPDPLRHNPPFTPHPGGARAVSLRSSARLSRGTHGTGLARAGVPALYMQSPASHTLHPQILRPHSTGAHRTPTRCLD